MISPKILSIVFLPELPFNMLFKYFCLQNVLLKPLKLLLFYKPTSTSTFFSQSIKEKILHLLHILNIKLITVNGKFWRQDILVVFSLEACV